MWTIIISACKTYQWYHLSCLPVQCSRRGFAAGCSVSATNVLLYASCATAFCHRKIPLEMTTWNRCIFFRITTATKSMNNNNLQSHKVNELKTTLVLICYSCIAELAILWQRHTVIFFHTYIMMHRISPLKQLSWADQQGWFNNIQKPYNNPTPLSAAEYHLKCKLVITECS